MNFLNDISDVSYNTTNINTYMEIKNTCLAVTSSETLRTITFI